MVAVISINVFGFLLALLLTRGIRRDELFRTVFLCQPYRRYCAGLYLAVYDKRVLAKYQVTMLMDAKYGFWGLVILMNWQLIGYIMIIYIAGLQNISPDLMEAAKIDGATSWQA